MNIFEFLIKFYDECHGDEVMDEHKVWFECDDPDLAIEAARGMAECYADDFGYDTFKIENMGAI